MNNQALSEDERDFFDWLANGVALWSGDRIKMSLKPANMTEAEFRLHGLAFYFCNALDWGECEPLTCRCRGRLHEEWGQYYREFKRNSPVWFETTEGEE